MKIGIDISQILYKGTGVARFTNGLTETILKYGANHQWVFFFSSLRGQLDCEIERKIKNNKYLLFKSKFPPTALSFMWNNIHKIKIEKIIGKFDWFITSDWTEPPSLLPKTTIVHDLTFLRFPQTVDNKILDTQRRRLPWVKKESKIIFADSQTTKKDLVDFFSIEPGKIIVNYPGVEIVAPSPIDIKQTLKKYNLTKPFILTVGKIEPRKNITELIKAFQRLDNKAIDLVVAGPAGWGAFDDSTRLPDGQDHRKQSSGIKFLGYINDPELFSLYSSCLFFVYPSIWEGFGYPVIEAMKLGCPVACSNNSSVKEIAGSAAYFFNPQDTNDILTAIKVMIDNDQLRKQLSFKGKIRSRIFNWKNYYNKLIANLGKNI